MYKILIIIAAIVAAYGIDFAICRVLRAKGKLSPIGYRKGVREIPLAIFGYTFLVAVAACIFIPFLYAVFLSFKTGRDVYLPKLFPTEFVLDNYGYVLTNTETNLLGSFFNSIWYSILPCTVGVLTSAMAAYALSRLHFKGRDKIFGILFATMCIPGVITLVPSYIMFARVYGWTDSPLPLIIPGMCGSVGVIFFLRQSLLALPRELDEAGIIDGLSKGGVFFRIILPISWPAILAQFLLAFNGGYNDFMGPLLYVGASKKWYTIQLTIYSMYSSNVRQIEQVMAACVLALLPSVLLFSFAQKYFMGSGISVEGLKG